MQLESMKNLGAIHQPGGHALPDNPFEEVFKGSHTPAALALLRTL